MAQYAPISVKQVCVPKNIVEERQLNEMISEVKKWCNEFRQLLSGIKEAVKGNRFVGFAQDIWYDYHTGLILPKLDSVFCTDYDIENFDKFIGDHKPGDYFLPFCGFEGRFITTAESKKVFSPDTVYTHKNKGKKLLDFVGDYIFTASSWNEYINPCQENDPDLLNLDLSKYSYYNRHNKKFRRLMVISNGKEKWVGNNQAKKLIVRFKKKRGGAWGMTSIEPVYDEDIQGNVKSATIIPVYPLSESHSKYNPTSDKELTDMIMKFIEHKLIPEKLTAADKNRLPYFFDTYKTYAHYLKLSDKTLYKQLSTASSETKNTLLGTAKSGKRVSTDIINDIFLNIDTRRANLSPYLARVLTDINMGHWELYEQIKNPPKNSVTVSLKKDIIARPPQLDVKSSGICAIDFGTKSTVVVCRNREERLLRVGKADYHKKPVMDDYENPTAVELRDIVGFQKAYGERAGRPYTEWEQITVSHQALSRLLENEENSIYQSVFSELKQWANEKHKVRRMRDQKEHDLLLPSYGELSNSDFDPIEIYAYYLGLYINNMVNGLYLEYILSFPVNYEKSVRDRLRESFERGIRKSLPPSILQDKEIMDDFRVYAGASEPAAYASCALKELGKVSADVRPTAEQPIYYGVFDFGGGTLDFDYGIWRLPTDDDKGSWNFVIEHFNAGGDVNLGGEKLLNLLAYEVYQKNVDQMRDNKIPFALPEGCQPFVGSEMLLTESNAAYLNCRRLSEMLRPLWEEKSDYEKMGAQPQNVLLYRDTDRISVPINIEVQKLRKILKQHIDLGVKNFFAGLLQAFRDIPVPVYHILMAGNSCKSSLVNESFQEEMKEREENIKSGFMSAQGQEKDFSGIFCLHLPLGSENKDTDNLNFDRIPTGKTGVAFGLLDCRKGGHDVLVIDHNLSAEKEVLFCYYLGYSDRADKFHVILGREVGYMEWVPFFYTNDDRFEIYFTSEPRALENQMDITEVPAPKKCRIHYKDDHEEGMIYIRKVAPNRIEYTVARDNGIEGEEYWAKVESCELGE